MKPEDNPNWFANSPVKRVNTEYDQEAFIAAQLQKDTCTLVPLWRGDPLVVGAHAGFLSSAARTEIPADAPMVFLGLRNGDTPYFGVDVSALAASPDAAPFAELGAYAPIREAAGKIDRDDLAVIGHARALFEWHRKHQRCAVCGAETQMKNGGAKRQCGACGAEHFPRTDPVAIVLAIHDGACLLGRGPQFPPGFLSALAGYIEVAETPEEAARRELFEEAGVVLHDIRYQFSQPWPFPSTLMMGFIADAESRDLHLDTNEIEEARWIERHDIEALLRGEERLGVFLPPKFTIARQLLERWAREA
ncbi:MAG: NAD(+) diphosphatase [Hyphococcus sp.]